MLIKKIDPKKPDKDIIIEAAEILKTGGIVAFPTDTVYGIAAMPFDKKAVRKLYRIKGREKKKPIALLVSSKSAASDFASRIPSVARRLMAMYWPGPLTLIFEKKKTVPPHITSVMKSIGIRMPDNSIALSIINAAGGALAVTSANISGKKAANSAGQIRKLKGIDLIIDGGKAKIGIPSSVIAFVNNKAVILRKGPGLKL